LLIEHLQSTVNTNDVSRNKITQAERVLAFPAIRAVFAGNACSRLRSKSLIPAYKAAFRGEIGSTRGRTEHLKPLYAIVPTEFSDGGLVLMNKDMHC